MPLTADTLSIGQSGGWSVQVSYKESELKISEEHTAHSCIYHWHVAWYYEGLRSKAVLTILYLLRSKSPWNTALPSVFANLIATATTICYYLEGKSRSAISLPRYTEGDPSQFFSMTMSD